MAQRLPADPGRKIYDAENMLTPEEREQIEAMTMGLGGAGIAKVGGAEARTAVPAILNKLRNSEIVNSLENKLYQPGKIRDSFNKVRELVGKPAIEAMPEHVDIERDPMPALRKMYPGKSDPEIKQATLKEVMKEHIAPQRDPLADKAMQNAQYPEELQGANYRQQLLNEFEKMPKQQELLPMEQGSLETTRVTLPEDAVVNLSNESKGLQNYDRYQKLRNYQNKLRGE